MPARFPPVLRSVCLLTGIVVFLVVIYQSTQERGAAGLPDLTANEAYLAHFAIYAVMTFFMLVAIAPRSVHALVALVLAAISLGVAMELYQAQTLTRSASARDAIADAIGVIAGLTAYFALGLLMEQQKRGLSGSSDPGS